MDSVNKYIASAINDTDRVNRINKFYSDELWRYNSSEPYILLKKALALAIKNNYQRSAKMLWQHD